MSVTSPTRRHRRRRRPPELYRVICDDCGASFAVSRRTYRERSLQRKGFHCDGCRNVLVAPNQNAEAPVRRVKCCSRRDHAWWVRRFPGRQLDDLLVGVFGAAAMTPERSERRAVLVASAAPQSRNRAA